MRDTKSDCKPFFTMPTEAQIWYRSKYLKSEAWKTVRTQALATTNARCIACYKRDLSNDVHHVTYPQSFKHSATKCTMAVLCRECHQALHAAMDMSGKKWMPREQFRFLLARRPRHQFPRSQMTWQKARASETRKLLKKPKRLTKESQVELGRIIRELRHSGCGKPTVVIQ